MIRKSYDVESYIYDLSRFGTIGGKYIDEVEKKLISSFLVGKTVLEVGVATGRFLIFLAKNGYASVGVDISRQMLEITQKKLDGENLEAHLIQMDGENLPFENCFDNVVCIHTFNFLPHPIMALRGMSRSLRIGGRIILIFYLSTTLRRIFESTKLTRIKRWLCSVRVFDSIFKKVSLFPSRKIWFYSVDEIARTLEKMGLKTIYRDRIFKFPYVFYRLASPMLFKVSKTLDSNRLFPTFGTIGIVIGERTCLRGHQNR